MKKVCLIFLIMIGKSFSAESSSESLFKNYLKKMKDSSEVTQYWIELANLKVMASQKIILNLDNSNKQVESYDRELHVGDSWDTIGLQVAKGYLDSALKRVPNRADIWMGKVQISSLIGRCNEIVIEYENFIKTTRRQESKLYISESQEVGDREQLYKDELSLSLDKFWAMAEYECVKKMAISMEKLNVNKFKALNALGSFYSVMKNDSALIYYEMALELSPKSEIINGNLAKFYIKKGDCSKAEIYAEKLIGHPYFEVLKEDMKDCREK